MKIIITGATGYIGSEVVRQASRDPAITRIFTLTRKPLPGALAKLPKVTGIVHTNFAEYPETLLEKLRGAEACVWMIGTPRPTTDPRPVDIGYTQAASHAFSTHLAPHIPSSSPNKKFRFVYTSGAASVRDQSTTLYFNSSGRLSRGAAETALLSFSSTSSHSSHYQALIVRPGLVRSKEWMVLNWDYMVKLEWLAAALLWMGKGGVGEEGGDVGGRTFENRELVEIGRRLCAELKS